MRVDVARPVDRLYAAGREGSFLKRGLRTITGEKLDTNLPANVTIDRSAIGRFIGRIERQQALKPVDAGINLTLTKVTVVPAKAGRRLAARDALMARLARRLTTSTDSRTLRAKTVEVKAKLTEDEVFDANPVAVTVSRNETKARLFKRGKLVKSYTVAVGIARVPDADRAVRRPDEAGEPVVERAELRVGGLARGPDDPRWRPEQPARRALDRLQRVGRLPWHGERRVPGHAPRRTAASAWRRATSSTCTSV